MANHAQPVGIQRGGHGRVFKQVANGILGIVQVVVRVGLAGIIRAALAAEVEGEHYIAIVGEQAVPPTIHGGVGV